MSENDLQRVEALGVHLGVPGDALGRLAQRPRVRRVFLRRPAKVRRGVSRVFDDPGRFREPRLALMDEQGIERIFSFPSLACDMEQDLAVRDPEACVAAFKAFNRWIDEEWGFNHEDRIYDDGRETERKGDMLL